jgi:HSP20 family protein
MQNRINRFVLESYSPEGPEEALTTTNFAPPVDIYEDEHTMPWRCERQLWQGVLKISLAKKAEAKPKQIKVNVGSEKTLEAKVHSKAA